MNGNLSNLLSVKSPSDGLESSQYKDCLGYQTKLPSLNAPGLPVQLFNSCHELDCALYMLGGPSGTGATMSLLAVL